MSEFEQALRTVATRIIERATTRHITAFDVAEIMLEIADELDASGDVKLIEIGGEA